MAILIRASDVPENRRHDAWRGIVCDTLGPLDLRIDPDAPLRGQIEAGRLDTVTVAHAMTSTPHSMHRTPGLIRRDNPELYRVVLVMSGSLVLTQRERSSRLRAGEFAVYDFTQPYDVAYDSAVELAVFSLPHESLTLLRDPVRALTAVPFAPDEGAAALAGPLLRRVALDLETYQPASAARLSSVVLNLITTAIAERADQTAVLPPETQQRALLMRVHDFIEQRLGDFDLDPGMIAAAHHVSLRYLHRLFESQNTTVAAWIRHRRLERCRADLADALLRTLPVSAVAARWGLPDAAHFSRLFKQTYGMPPAEYRRMRA
ncbi:helix-turn-helix domain-containing protein [Nonomuraea sediminis]|uniref:helix-turn-helix domain-containing protein n=1 Tax=Nonomuraea sediminis TaxID=2835864 RepID=UPI001BDC31EB|nr:helix-turn-helix domain-containing protein [Nonomuraea sediminis]